MHTIFPFTMYLTENGFFFLRQARRSRAREQWCWGAARLSVLRCQTCWRGTMPLSPCVTPRQPIWRLRWDDDLCMLWLSGGSWRAVCFSAAMYGTNQCFLPSVSGFVRWLVNLHHWVPFCGNDNTYWSISKVQTIVQRDHFEHKHTHDTLHTVYKHF